MAVLLVAQSLQKMDEHCDGEGTCTAAPSGDPYAILGVATDANKDEVIKAYRALARRWHPDRNRGKSGVEKTFATIAHAYNMLKNGTTREILDRLGEEGLERLRNGDPSVLKDWVPPDEVLRRIHNDPPESWFEYLITSTFACLGLFPSLLAKGGLQLRILLGLEKVTSSVYITATDASASTLISGGTTGGDAMFKFDLSGKSEDFAESDITHNCASSRFLGMKTTFYLECFHTAALNVSVSVEAKAFHVRGKSNAASSIFTVSMI